MTTKKSMKAVFDCSADEPGELSFKEGDILVDVEESGEEGWYTGRIQNTSETGLFPYNYVVELPAVQPQKNNKEKPLSKFPPIDAFEAAMSSGKTSKSSSSNNNNWTSLTPSTMSNTNNSPPIIGIKPKLSTPSTLNSSNVGLGIKVHGNNNTSTFEKPQLKPIGSIISIDTSPTRSRSYSTSAVLNKSEKEPIHTEKTLRPSQLLNGKGTKSALELALSKGSPKSSSSSNLKSNNAFSKNNNPGGIALPGMSNIKLNSNSSSNSNNNSNNNNNNNDTEEEDGFQMIKPSQLRQRQQLPNSTPIRPIISQSSSYASSTTKSAITSSTPSWKKTPDSKVTSTPINTFNVGKASPSSSLSSSPGPLSTSKLDAAPSSTPMPRLHSRPVSTASRRSRNSRNSTSSIKSSPTSSSKTTPNVSNACLPPVKETIEKSAPPPILKPKPQMSTTATNAAAAAAQPNLPPRPKLRSTSNPPPIQPKPAMSSIEILLSKSNNNKSESIPAASPSIAPSKSTTPPPRNAAKKPVVSTTKPNFVSSKNPNLSARPGLDSWQSMDNAKNQQVEDVNIKPSALLKNNRARSATNPISSSSPTTSLDWMTALKPKPATTTKPVLYERPTSPVAYPVSRSPAPVAAAVIEPAKKKSNPPPPPPSRPPKNLNNTNNTSSKSSFLDSNNATKQRYEILFETIHDDGFVDGETAHFLWLKSKLSNEDLARIWKECDPDHKGLLDKHAFIDGMSKIDELLYLKQQQQQQAV